MATRKKPKAVVGVFNNRVDAEQAVEDLHRAGFRRNQIGLVSRDKNGKTKKDKNETYAEEGATAGVIAGAGAGALIGLGILAGVIPGIGPAIAGGTLGVLLSNAALGAAVAGLAGALIGLGIPEDDAEWYESELKAGRTIVTVKTGTRQAEASEILMRHNGYDRSSSGTITTRATGKAAVCETTSRSARTSDDAVMEVHEEELEARKRPVKTGDVKVRKEVITEHKTIEVPVRREEVVVERRPLGRRAAGAASVKSEEIRIPVSSEEVDVRKRTVAKEEVKVSKRVVEDKEKVSGTVRREKVRVEPEGGARVRSR